MQSVFYFLNLAGFILLFLMMILQGYLPLNPQQFSGTSWHLALNTAVSFMTNTNCNLTVVKLPWIHGAIAGTYGPEFPERRYRMAVFVALIRGLTSKTTTKLGNFWVDLTRSVVYILMPLSIILAITACGTGSCTELFTLC